MSKKHFSWLLGITVVVALVILLMPGKTSRESSFEVHPLVAGLDARVNDISRVRITAGGNRAVATLVRNDNRWVVEEAGSYPADWARLKALMAAIAQAEVTEPKTANPEYFSRLGLTDVADAASSAIKVELGEGDGAVSLLVGNAAKEREGQYVRLESENQALLINKTLDVPGDTKSWLERNIVDVAEAEVVEVNITNPGGESITLLKKSADDADFVLQDIPKGREIASAWTVNSLAGGLAGLELEEARSDAGIDWAQASHVRMLTADGLEVKAELANADEKQWLRLTAAAYPAASANEETAAPADAETPAAPETSAPATTEADAGAKVEGESKVDESTTKQQLSDRVDAINQRVKGWAYVIPQYKSDLMQKHMEDLLKPVEKE